MAIVDFNTCIWKDPWFRKLTLKAKNLFIFLWTNDHKNLPCLYQIDMETMSFYTGLPKKEVIDTLSILYPKVKYDFEKEIVWVVNFVRHQFLRTINLSPKIKAGIENNLLQMNGHFFIREFLEEYPRFNLPDTYTIDTLSIGYAYPPGEGKGEGKGEGEGEGKGKGKGEGKKKEKFKYLECILLTKEQHQKLLGKYGESKTDKMIEELNNYKMSSGKKYESDYHALIGWVSKKFETEAIGGNNGRTQGSTGAIRGKTEESQSDGQPYPVDAEF